MVYRKHDTAEQIEIARLDRADDRIHSLPLTPREIRLITRALKSEGQRIGVRFPIAAVEHARLAAEIEEAAAQ